jgi:flavin reductase (DIM6/NTAB) family NADH-FMN oxidoreductase RutF
VPPDAKSADFRLAMREFASGVAIVTCANGKERAGCTATALASLSLSPPSLVICLERCSSTLAVLTQVGAFAVNILAAQHGALASRFAGGHGVEGEARFEEGDWSALETGAPALVDALASLDCRVEEIVARHTHAVVIGDVQAVRVGTKRSGLCTGAVGSRPWIEVSLSRRGERNGLLIHAPPSTGSHGSCRTSARCQP